MDPQRHDLNIRILKKDGMTGAIGAKIKVIDTITGEIREGEKTTIAGGRINEPFELEENLKIKINVEYTDPVTKELFLQQGPIITMTEDKNIEMTLKSITDTTVTYDGMYDPYGRFKTATEGTYVMQTGKTYFLSFTLGMPNISNGRWDSITLKLTDKLTQENQKIEFLDPNIFSDYELEPDTTPQRSTNNRNSSRPDNKRRIPKPRHTKNNNNTSKISHRHIPARILDRILSTTETKRTRSKRPSKLLLQSTHISRPRNNPTRRIPSNSTNILLIQRTKHTSQRSTSNSKIRRQPRDSIHT